MGEGDGNTLGCLMFVDDIVLLAENNDTIQRPLEVVGGYGREFTVNFRADNSQVRVNEGIMKERERDRRMLGDLEMKRMWEYKYFGVTFTQSGL